jgi:hypothetical protein
MILFEKKKNNLVGEFHCFFTGLRLKISARMGWRAWADPNHPLCVSKYRAVSGTGCEMGVLYCLSTEI